MRQAREGVESRLQPRFSGHNDGVATAEEKNGARRTVSSSLAEGGQGAKDDGASVVAGSPAPHPSPQGGGESARHALLSKAHASLTLARLMTWLSPAFPVGGFSYSHGLEWMVEAGKVDSAATLGEWIVDILVHGAGRTDAIFLASAWRAVAASDIAKLDEAADLAAAFAPSAERRLETLAQGTAFIAAVKAVWPHSAIDALGKRQEIAFPVAVGACAAAHGLPLAETAQAFVQAFAANLVSAGVRLIPLGQTDGLRVIARLEPLIAREVVQALGAGLDDVGGIAVLADIASMRHETQYTRLFRS